MALLCEYAVTPDVFDIASYSNEEEGTARFEYLKDVFLEEVVLRNLRNGEWLSFLKHNERSWHRRGKELLMKMEKQNRLLLSENALPVAPSNDVGWCREALASHEINPSAGVISTVKVANDIGPNPILARIDRLGSSPTWTARSSSERLARNEADYEEQLHLIMKCANSVMLIDPHLDPTKDRYGHVLRLLLLAQDRRFPPLIEIHRVKSGPNPPAVDSAEWENRFRNEWGTGLSDAGLHVEVFIWDKHHDRYLITDLIGIQMANGYDISKKPNDITTWCRMSRKARDDIQREFDPASHRHNLIHRFVIP
jgi:hypothetical protein